MSLLLAAGGYRVVGAGGIASAEAFGQPTVTFRSAVIGAGGIVSAEAIGQPAVNARWAVAGAGGIASAEAFGQPTVSFSVAVVGAGGIASVETFGLPTVTYVGGDAQQAVGGRRRRPRPQWLGPQYTPFVFPVWHSVVDAGGIASGEAFGLPIVTTRRNVKRRRKEEIELLAV